MLETISHIGMGSCGYVDLTRVTEVTAGTQVDLVWLKPPVNGLELAKKRACFNDDFPSTCDWIRNEQAALERLQPSFEGRDSRPIMMYGYGEEPSPLSLKFPFLLLESVNPPFVSLGQLIRNDGRLSLDETLILAKEVAGILATSHKEFGGHNDLLQNKKNPKVIGAERHIFINPLTGKTIIIDWDTAGAGKYESDIAAMGQILFRSLVGHHIVASVRLKEELETIHPSIKRIIRKTDYWFQDTSDEFLEHYPLVPEGMEMVLEDLKSVKT